MRYRIDREELSGFLTRQVRLVERLPVEAADAAADGYGDGLDEAEREAVWLAAGIAAFIGQAIADEPERFIVAAGDHRAVAGCEFDDHAVAIERPFRNLRALHLQHFRSGGNVDAQRARKLAE